MGRPHRFSAERNELRQQVDWVIKYIRDHGPISTHDLVEVMKTEHQPIQAHVLQRALRKSAWIHAVGSHETERGKVTIWQWGEPNH